MKALLVAAIALLVPLATATERPPLASCPSGQFTPFGSKGCYSDNGSSSVLDFRSPSSQYSMTVEQCTAECKGNGYRYAGLKYYGVCYCGSSLNAAKVDDSQCSLACSGNKNELCGGNTQLSVWEDPTFSKCGNDITSNDYESLGCYDDDGSSEGRALNHKLDLDANTFTTKLCLDACRVRGYAFAGTEYGSECWCGTNVGSKNIKVDNSKCDMPCQGSPSSKCGGHSLINLYHAKQLESTQPCSGLTPVVSSSSSAMPTTQTAQTGPAPSTTATRTRRRCSVRRPFTTTSSTQTSPTKPCKTSSQESGTPNTSVTSQESGTPLPSMVSSQEGSTAHPSTTSSQATSTPQLSTVPSGTSSQQQSSATPNASSTTLGSTTPQPSATTSASSTQASSEGQRTSSSLISTPGSSTSPASSTSNASTTKPCTDETCSSSAVSTPASSVTSRASTTEPCTDNISSSTLIASITSQATSTPGSSLPSSTILGTSSTVSPIASASTVVTSTTKVSSTEPCTDNVSSTTKATSTPNSSVPASSISVASSSTAAGSSTSKISSTEPCTDSISSTIKPSTTTNPSVTASSTQPASTSKASSTEPCTDSVSSTAKASSTVNSSVPAGSSSVAISSTAVSSTSKASSTEPCTDSSSTIKPSSTSNSAMSTSISQVSSSAPPSTSHGSTTMPGTTSRVGSTTDLRTTTAPTTTQRPSTTSTQAMCTATHTQPATCEFKCGNWCAPALPDWKDQNSCLNAAKTCSLQIASCFKTAGWPKAIECFDFSKWCGQVEEYCHSDCPSGNCGKTDCWNKRKPSGSNGTPPTISTTVYPCPVTSTLATSVARPSTTSHCAPTPTNICKQPSNSDWGYGPGKPVAGVPLPVVGCNDNKNDWQSNPFKYYNHPDSRSCQSFPWNQRPDVCADACQEQYEDCLDTYVQSCNDQSWRDGSYHKRTNDDGGCAASNTGSEWQKSGCDKVHCWGQGGNDGNTAQKRCKAQYQDCLAVNKNVQPSTECNTWCDAKDN